MRKIFYITMLFLFTGTLVFAQVGINTDNSSPDPSAMLDVKSSSKGFLPPRLSATQRNAIVSPVSGLLIFNTDCNDMQYYNGAEWVPVGKTGLIATPGTISGNTSAWVNTGQITYSIDPIPGATGYSWSVPPGATIVSGQGTPIITVYCGIAVGSICVSAYNDCYRSSINCLPVNFTPILPLGISITASATSVCSESTVTYTAVPVNGGTDPVFAWKVNGIHTGTNSPSFSYIPSNHDEVSCDLTNSTSITTGDTAHSNVIAMEVSITGPVALTINAAPHMNCNNAYYDFTAIPSNGGDSPLYQWSMNGEAVPGATNSNFSTNITGRVECHMISNSLCITGSSEVMDFLDMGGCEIITNGDPIYLYCTLPGCDNPGASYNWVNSSGSWISHEREPVIYPDTNGYATDVFYLTVNFEPPVGSYSNGISYIQVAP